MKLSNLFKTKGKTNLVKHIIKPDDVVVRYYAMYFIKQLKERGLTEFNINLLHTLLISLHLEYYEKYKEFLFDTPILREKCILKLLSLRNFFNNLDNVKNIDDIVETESLEIDKVLKVKKDFIKRTNIKIPQEAKIMLDEKINGYIGISNENLFALNDLTNALLSLLMDLEKIPVITNATLEEMFKKIGNTEINVSEIKNGSRDEKR